ncbi:hypothetical protein [Thioclava pacifica]|uniref:Sulfotransferase domain-containing protein n=1 Tax=Thioclava pacifica DSM 10166 TaxID=1353537 RepID=A0A074JI69_9RHOB|nr:hypothetical protein [Thioclava pacifica]KEO56149.1 hypothetical protein TP2_01120 [Thioclava pacifica DSM 10166]
MRRLYLHVGTHKTGTTSLQAYLRDHRDTLQAQGLTVLTEVHKKQGEIAVCLGFAHGILRDGLQTVARMTGAMPKAGSMRAFLYRAEIRRQLKALPRDGRAVLSAEALCFAREPEEAARLRKVFAKLDLEIVPVICFRNEADWRASWENELQRFAAQMTEPFGTGTNDIRGDWYFDPAAIMSFREAFGPVRRIDFDAAVARDGTVLPALLDALDVTAQGDLADYRLRQSNPPA